MEHNHSYSLELLSHLSDTFRQFQLVPCAWVHFRLLPSCLTFCHSIDCSPSGSSMLGILQAKILECVAIPSSRGSSQPRDWTHVFCIASEFSTVWTTREAQEILEWVAYPFSRGFSQPRVSCIADRFLTSWARRWLFWDTSLPSWTG